MKTKLQAMMLALLFTFGRLWSADDGRIPIAVNDLKGAGIDKTASVIASDRLRSELVKTGMFRVMERAEMETILKEQGFQETGTCDETSCIVKVGQLLGVRLMVAGSIGKSDKFWTISLRTIDVATGEILFTVDEDFEGDIKSVISEVIAKAAVKLAAKEEALQYATLKVTTKPAGAEVYLNDKQVGITPFANSRLQPGTCKLTLNLHTYEIITDNFQLAKSQAIEKQYDLAHTKAYFDSVKNAASVSYKKIRWIRRIAFGVLAAGCGVTGFVFNSQSDSRYNTYMSDKSDNAVQHDSDWKSVKDAETARNVFYSIGAVCTVGCAVSIPF